MASSVESDGVSPTVAINHLSFTHQNGTKALVDVVLDVKAGSRVLIIGSNGAGKSTLLQICAGKRMIPASSVSLLSQDVFRKTPPGVTFLGTEWAMNPHVRGDILVSAFLDSVGEEFPTHVAHMRDGTFVQQPVPWPVAPGMATHASLYNLALNWLKEDREVRIQEEKIGQRTKRGARRDEVPTDSETFYKKYDYSH
ncbi:CCR4-NOT regulatory complex component [Serendipita sp. 405]|nr:CCR4-NOT regulatory complex component [Serendipita sp. 405]